MERRTMGFSFQDIMKILMDDAGLTVPKLAERLDRERSLVNKWMSGRHKPRLTYIPQIVEIVLKQATVSQGIVITSHLTEYIHASVLPKELKNTLLSKSSDCSAFLLETLTISLSDIPVEVGGLSQATMTRWNQYLSTPVCAIIAAFIGGALWNLSNHLFGWTYYMGSPGGEPYGFSAFIWGILTFLPIAVIAALFTKAKTTLKPRIFTLIIYTITGSLFALLFYTSGIRIGIEHAGLSYEMREIIIVIIYSFFISFPPYVVLRICAKTKVNNKATAWHVCLPVVAALFAVVLTLFIGRPEIEVAGVRGLLVGMLMKSCMFYITTKYFQYFKLGK